MKFKNKMLIVSLIFLLISPSVQANILEDIPAINQGLQDANDKLDTISSSIDEMNSNTQNLSESILLIEQTNQELQNMRETLDEVSDRLTEALSITDNVDNYIDDIKLLLSVGIITIIMAILTLIGVTVVILRKRK